MFHKKKVVENVKTHVLCLVTFFRKSCSLCDNVEKYGRSGKAGAWALHGG